MFFEQTTTEAHKKDAELTFKANTCWKKCVNRNTYKTERTRDYKECVCVLVWCQGVKVWFLCLSGKTLISVKDL